MSQPKGGKKGQYHGETGTRNEGEAKWMKANRPKDEQIIMYIYSGNQVFSLSNISMQHYQENGCSKVIMCGQMGDKIEEAL